MLTWLDGRNTSSFGNLSWNGNTLGFTVTPGTGANGLQAMLPTHSSATGNLSLITGLGNSSVAYTTVTIKGIDYAFFPAAAGAYTATYQALPLTITTTALSAATVNVGYFATLTARGGTTPYTWSIIGGALPTGLSLNPGTGAITGTPNTAGTFNITVKVSDAATGTASINLSIAVARDATSIWPSTAVPGLVDAGPDSAVELGVKFTSNIGGTITGIRFYKASTNTGTHVGNLWSSAGTLLASATFSGETASGWQQVNFSAPVTISANTVYVASYHANAGHYSADLSYFASTGVNNPPLQALANGVSGGDGVYTYGSTSAFPSGTWNATNYWVDVAFTAANIPMLQSISVTPANPAILTGATQQFTATGTYSDSSTQNLTNQVVWSSSTPAVGTILQTGIATGLSSGSTTIQALMGEGLSASTLVTVNATPLTITTTSLPSGTLNVAYPATTLTASNGTSPYTWSITSGVLPTGLSLNTSTGAISGTPTAIGTFSFTAQVSDSTMPIALTASTNLSITVATAATSIWPSTAVPTLIDSGPDSAVELGVKFKSDVGGTITGIRFYKASVNTGTHIGNLWSSTGTLLATAIFSGETTSGWQQVLFSSPVAIIANTVYVASYHANAGHYSADASYFGSAGVDNPPLHALANGVSGGDGVYAYGSTSVFPTGTWNSSNYWVDVTFNPSGTVPLNVTTTSLPGGAVNVSYSATLTASGGTTPYTWSIASGALPTGLSLNASTGAITGTPTATGTSASLSRRAIPPFLPARPSRP